jgi:general stress protein CsbA
MITIFALLMAFLGIGLFARKYNGWVRLLLLAVICGVVLYETLI